MVARKRPGSWLRTHVEVSLLVRTCCLFREGDILVRHQPPAFDPARMVVRLALDSLFARRSGVQR